MDYKKIEKGVYSFKGIDNWNGKEIEGHIVYQPFDVPLSRAWSVRFGMGTDNADTPFFGKSLKDCKKWLTN